MTKLFQIIALVLSSLLLVSPVYAQDENGTDTVTVNESNPTEEAAESDNTLDQAENLNVTIYVDKNCPHCRNVEEFVDEYGLGEYVTYKELSASEETFNELEALWETFEVSDSEKGWPFMVYETAEGVTDYAVGDSPIIEYLAEVHDIDIDEVDPNNSNGNDSQSGNGLMLLGGLFFFGIIGYVVYSMIFDKKQ